VTGRVAVVTDSTASLPTAVVEAAGIVVVPLQVVIDGLPYREGVDLSPVRLVEALLAGATVTTSQPGPAAFSRVYSRVAARGAQEIVSIHLSGDLSSTVASARLAAATAPVPVHVVDSRSVAMGLGLAAVAAAQGSSGLPGSSSGKSIAAAAGARAAGSCVLFAVDSLEHLRRGGRLGPLAAALGTVLGLRPVIGVRDGHLEVVEKVRTSARARERLFELAVADAGRRGRFDIAVHHLGQPELAAGLGERLRNACGPQLRAVHTAEVSAVLGAHVGPGLLAVVVADV
jgi:DegV family protein with EDD domain